MVDAFQSRYWKAFFVPQHGRAEILSPAYGPVSRTEYRSIPRYCVVPPSKETTVGKPKPYQASWNGGACHQTI